MTKSLPPPNNPETKARIRDLLQGQFCQPCPIGASLRETLVEPPPQPKTGKPRPYPRGIAAILRVRSILKDQFCRYCAVGQALMTATEKPKPIDLDATLQNPAKAPKAPQKNSAGRLGSKSKMCKRCRIAKPLSHFRKNKACPSGHVDTCDACRNPNVRGRSRKTAEPDRPPKLPREPRDVPGNDRGLPPERHECEGCGKDFPTHTALLRHVAEDH